MGNDAVRPVRDEISEMYARRGPTPNCPPNSNGDFTTVIPIHLSVETSRGAE